MAINPRVTAVCLNNADFVGNRDAVICTMIIGQAVLCQRPIVQTIIDCPDRPLPVIICGNEDGVKKV